MRIKRVEVKVMSRDNKKVIRTFRLTPPLSPQGKQLFTPEGADRVLSEVIEEIDRANPDHKYRLVSLGRYCYKLVWDDAIECEAVSDAG